jgi:hypothetical protein
MFTQKCKLDREGKKREAKDERRSEKRGQIYVDGRGKSKVTLHSRAKRRKRNCNTQEVTLHEPDLTGAEQTAVANSKNSNLLLDVVKSR